MDDELIGYIFRFVSNFTDNMHTNITGVHEVFKAAIVGHGDDWMNYNDESVMTQIKNNEERDLFQILEQKNEDSDED